MLIDRYWMLIFSAMPRSSNESYRELKTQLEWSLLLVEKEGV